MLYPYYLSYILRITCVASYFSTLILSKVWDDRIQTKNITLKIFLSKFLWDDIEMA